MKILCIAWHLTPTDGWGTLARNTVLGLKKGGHDVEALVHETTEECDCTQYTGLPAPLGAMTNPFDMLRTWRAIRRAVRRTKPDIIHFLTEPYILAVPRDTTPVVLTVCGTYGVFPLHKKITRRLMLRAYNKASAVMAISRYTEKRMLEEVGRLDAHDASLLADKTTIVTLGIDATDPRPSPDNAVKQMLFVGGVKPRKGVLEILKACDVFRTRFGTAFRLRIIGHCGNDAYAQSVRRFIEEHHLTENVSLDGHIPADELEKAYENADLFIMLSKPAGLHFEGFGLVFLEANARGIPVIGPSGSGCVDAIAHGKSGFIVDPDDADSAAACMLRIMKGEIDAADCIHWAREHSIKRQADETFAVYGRILH